MKHILLLFLVTFSAKIYSQDYFKVEFSSGYILLDRFHDNKDFNNVFYSSMVQTDFTVFRNLDLGRKFNIDLGLGYTGYTFIDRSPIIDSLSTVSYISFKSRFNHRLFFDRLDIVLGQSTYYSIYGNNTDNDFFGIKQKLFTNIDIGFKYRLSEKFDLSVTTPVTIHPMYRGLVGFEAKKQTFDVFGETIGFNMGISYKFKKS